MHNLLVHIIHVEMYGCPEHSCNFVVISHYMILSKLLVVSSLNLILYNSFADDSQKIYVVSYIQ